MAAASSSTLLSSALSMAAASSTFSGLPSDQLADQPVTPHDIFLSHSGAQKGFVKDLYDCLGCRGFNSFFDITHHSLPLAESFPKRIFSAAKNCKLAVVVLSEEFVSSKWPMIELSAFVKAGVRILPLFYNLSPADLKNDRNLKRWGERWEDFSAQDTRIKLTEWGDAIKAICSQNGLTFNGQAVEGETTYLHRVVSGICEIVPPAIKFDGPHIPGMNRLCQEVLRTFKTMESEGRVSVVGLYGLAGSGKSTLCKCMVEHFFKIYGGRSLHVELPTNPSTADLLHQFKKLLHLTDFQGRHNLDSVSELEQLFNLLASYQLPSCRVFLVIDNISDGSWEALRMFLPLGVAPGSKVILAARTSDILQPTFLLLEQYGQHYIWKMLQIPSIQEIEAIQILLQTSGHAVQHKNLTPTQRETVVRIVRMCNFGSEYDPQYLPLVMKTMGAMLIKYEGNFVQWGNDLQKFWRNVKGYKEKVVKDLVEKSFKALPDEELQLLFLDLSLFILPLNLESLEEVYVLLSNIYDGCSVADIERMIKDLERHCFLTTPGKCRFSIHDVYLEFAKSISKSSKRYYWRNDKYTGAKDEKVLSLKEVDQGTGVEHPQVRAMILENGGYERVELQGFSNLKALAVRNCKALTVLGLVGLSSLASLDILNCPNLRHIIDGSNSSNVKRLRIKGDGQAAGDIKGGKTLLGWLGDLSQSLKQWLTLERSSLEMGIATKIRGLQDLRLENTGIRRLMNMSSCWPQLQNLTVKECYLEAFEVGNLPNLKCFSFEDHNSRHIDWSLYTFDDKYITTETWERKKENPRFMLQGKGLLEGCPQLEQVAIQSAFFEKGELGTALPPNMVSFRLGFLYPAMILPDLSPAAHTLEEVDLRWCEKLEKLSFLVEFGKLRHLSVQECHSLVELTGLGFLCSLRFFSVRRCSNLRAISGPFDNLKMLETFRVEECPKSAGLAGADLENLVNVVLLAFPLKRAGRFNVKNLQNLRALNVKIIEDESELCSTSTMQQGEQLGGMLDGLEHLVNLEVLLLRGTPISSNDEHERRKAAALQYDIAHLILPQTLPQRPSTSRSTTTTTGYKCPKSLQLNNLSELASMDGLEQLSNLEMLFFFYLENLRCLRGLLSLVRLKVLWLEHCPMLEELPSLHTFVNLCRISIRHCSKLKAVQGADAIVKSGSLPQATFEGCKSLEHLPISAGAFRAYEDEHGVGGQSFDLEFEDCRFASREAMMAWAVSADMPWSLRRPSLKQLLSNTDSSLREDLFDGLFPSMLSMCVPNNDNKCINFKNREWQDKVGGVAKKDLLHKFQAHPEWKLSFLHDFFGHLTLDSYYGKDDKDHLSFERILHHLSFERILHEIFDDSYYDNYYEQLEVASKKRESN